MPWRLIVLIVILALLLGFIGVNLDNTCDISLGFNIKIPNVPVFITVFASFLMGMIASLPFIIFGGIKKKHKTSHIQVSPVAPATPAASVPPAKPSFIKGIFKKKTDDVQPEKTDDIGPYGID